MSLSWALMLTMPNGGSTAVARMLLTAPGTIALQDKAEGQWLVPEMSAPGVRWDPSSAMDYGEIRSIWMAAALQAASGPSLVIEKSPPNLCRWAALADMLSDMPVHILVLTRDPFAICASWNSRVGAERIGTNWGWPGPAPETEDEFFRSLGRIWLLRARHLSAARERSLHWMRYEDVAVDPAATIAALGAKLPVLLGADPGRVMKVKDYPPQTIRNMNAEQIATLTPRQLAIIAEGLAEDPALVTGFGYRVEPPAHRPF